MPLIVRNHPISAAQLDLLDPAEGWDDLIISAQAVNPPGGVDAAVYNLTESTVDFRWDKSRRLDVSYQYPHKGVLTTPELRFHLHTYRDIDGTGENIRWEVKWRVALEGGVKQLWTTEYAVTPAPAGTGPKVIPIKDFDLGGIGWTISDCLQIQLTRTPTHGDDTFLGDVQVYNLDAHVKLRKATGSPNEYSF